MTLMTAPRKPTPIVKPLSLAADARPRRRRPSRAEIQGMSVARLKSEIEPSRITLCSGCHLIASFKAHVGLEGVLAELARFADDPAVLALADRQPWPWRPGEDLAVWHANRLVALATRGDDGRAVVRRL